MKLWIGLAAAFLLATFLAGCMTPSENAYGNRDALNRTPFWERNDQRDR